MSGVGGLQSEVRVKDIALCFCGFSVPSCIVSVSFNLRGCNGMTVRSYYANWFHKHTTTLNVSTV